MAIPVKRQRGQVAPKVTIENPYADVFAQVVKPYVSLWQMGWWSTVGILLIAFLWWTRGVSELTGVVAIVLLYLFAFVPIYLGRASSAMLFSQVSPEHVARCAGLLQTRAYNRRQLRTIKDMACNDRDNLPQSTTFTSIFWPFVIALVVGVFGLPQQFQIQPWMVIVFGIVVTIPFLSALSQAERSNANLVIIQAVTLIESLKADRDA